MGVVCVRECTLVRRALGKYVYSLRKHIAVSVEFHKTMLP